MTKQKLLKIYKIKLRNSNKVAIVDIDQKPFVQKHVWYLKYRSSHGTKDYIAYVQSNINGKTVMLHNFIMKHKPTKKYTVDHINRDPLDNRKSNLRIVNQTIQNINHKKQKNNKSGVIGVSLEKQENRWLSRWNENKKPQKEGFNYKDFKSFRESFIKAVILRKDKEREIEEYRIGKCLPSFPYSESITCLWEPQQLFNEFIEKKPKWKIMDTAFFSYKFKKLK